MTLYFFAFCALVGMASAGTVIWDGRLNQQQTAAFLDRWSWSNQVGPYQWYIHGSGNTSDYVGLSNTYKNPADTASKQGMQITIDDTSSWNGQTMMRTELIPQTTAAINKGKVFYHFSMQHTGIKPPSPTEEHQVCFFESHFTEMKFGASGSSSNLLQWLANSQSHWNVTFDAGVWHNIAYAIDFDAQTVTFYHSTGANDLKLTAGPVTASTTSNGADWHVGVLRLPSSSGTAAGAENWHFSGVYIEIGGLTLSVSGSGASSSTVSASSVKLLASTVASPPPTTFQTKVASTTRSTVISQTSIMSYVTRYPVSSSSPAPNPTNTAINPAPTFGVTLTDCEAEST